MCKIRLGTSISLAKMFRIQLEYSFKFQIKIKYIKIVPIILKIIFELFLSDVAVQLYTVKALH